MYLNLSEPLTLRRLLGFYEKSKFRMINRYLKQGMVFVDVGANLGDYSLVISRLIGPTGKVIAFEPDPSNFDWFSKSVVKNRLNNVEIRREALSDRDGEATLFLGEVSGWHTLKSGRLAREKGELIVKTRKLDSLMFDRLDLMKIDVEGAELEVLQGARGQLAKHRPILLIDLHPTKGGDIGGTLKTLQELNYNVYGIDAKGRCAPYAEHLCEIVAIPEHLRRESC